MTIFLVGPLRVYLNDPDTGIGDIQSTVEGDVVTGQGQAPPLTLQVGNVLLYILYHRPQTNLKAFSPSLLLRQYFGLLANQKGIFPRQLTTKLGWWYFWCWTWQSHVILCPGLEGMYSGTSSEIVKLISKPDISEHVLWPVKQIIVTTSKKWGWAHIFCCFGKSLDYIYIYFFFYNVGGILEIYVAIFFVQVLYLV